MYVVMCGNKRLEYERATKSLSLFLFLSLSLSASFLREFVLEFWGLPRFGAYVLSMSMYTEMFKVERQGLYDCKSLIIR